MTPLASQLRPFLAQLDPHWRRAAVDPALDAIDDLWAVEETALEAGGNLLVVASLTLLAYYRSEAARRRGGPKDPVLDLLVARMIGEATEGLPYTGAQAVSAFECALQAKSVDLVAPGALKARHVVLLQQALTRDRLDPWSSRWRPARAVEGRLGDLVADVLGALKFLTRIRVKPQRNPVAILEREDGPRSVEFTLAPFFLGVCDAESDSWELLPFWRTDVERGEYVYISRSSGREERRRRPSRVAGGRSHRLMTVLLAGSFGALRQFTFRTAEVLQRSANQTLLRRLLAKAWEPLPSPDEITRRLRAFRDEPVLETWRLMAKLEGPIGLLEFDPQLAEAVWREVHPGEGAPEQQSLDALLARGEESHVPPARALALDVARMLELDVQESQEAGAIERLQDELQADERRLDAAPAGSAAELTDATVLRWGRALEAELKFLVVFYASIPYSAVGRIRDAAPNVRSMFDRPGLGALWGLLVTTLRHESVRAALHELTRRSVSEEPAFKDLKQQLAMFNDRIRPPVAHDGGDARLRWREVADCVGAILRALGGAANYYTPIHPYSLQFRQALFTSGGLSTMRYVTYIGSNNAEVEVYTSQQIDLARTYYCLPRIGQSYFAKERSRGETADGRPLLVDPLLVDTREIDAVVEAVRSGREVDADSDA